jgi:N-acetylneuraminic acid mutarotase
MALTIFMMMLLFLGTDGAFLASATDSAWSSKAPMQVARSGLGVAVVNGKIYAIGGADGSAAGFSSTNEEYDPATETWAFRSPMPTPRSDFGIVVYDNKIYCIGGYVKGSPPTGVAATSVEEVYDPATDSWTTKTPMPTARLNLRANVVNGKIYLIGGIPIPDTGRTLNEVYDPVRDIWTTKSPMPTGVDSYASAVVGSKIFVIKSGLTQIYDTENDSWSTGAAPPTNSFIPSSAAIATSNSPARIFLFGANTEGAYWMLTNQGFTTQSYDPIADNWTVGTPMLTGRFDTGIAVANDKLIVIGGYNYGTPSGPGLTLNRPVIYSSANEQYTPSLDFFTLANNTQATETANTLLPTPMATPAQSQTTTPLQTLSPLPTPSPTSASSPTQTSSLSSSLTHSPTFKPSPTQTPNPSYSPSAPSIPNSGSTLKDVSTPQFPQFLLLSATAVIAVITVILAAKKKHK